MNRFANEFALSFRDGPKDQTRNLEIPRCAIAHLRFALRAPRNDLSNHAVAARKSRSAAARASAVISAPASMRAISSRRGSAARPPTRVGARLALARGSLENN